MDSLLIRVLSRDLFDIYETIVREICLIEIYYNDNNILYADGIVFLGILELGLLDIKKMEKKREKRTPNQVSILPGFSKTDSSSYELGAGDVKKGSKYENRTLM